MTGAEQLLAAAVMLAPVLCCLVLARRRTPGRLALGAAAGTAVLAIVWALHRAAYEGPTIIELTAQRGITVVDLVVPVALAVSAAVGWRFWRG